MTGICHGRDGLYNLKSRFLNWRMNIAWYLMAMLAVPVALSAILLVLSSFSDVYTPKIITEGNHLNLVITGILTGLLGGGLFEEVGWTGFAVPELRKKYNITDTGLILGFFWGLWHFLPVWWGSGDINGKTDWILFLPGLFSHYAVLVPFRVILVWLHDRTQSLIPVILMHASLTAFILFVLNISATGLPLFVYNACFSGVLFIAVAIITATDRKTGSKPSGSLQQKGSIQNVM
jgi:membrane protease YdiL (CAAX protease family)